MTVSGAGNGPGAFARASNGRGRWTTNFRSSVNHHEVSNAATTVPVAAMPRRFRPRDLRRRNARIHQKNPFQFR